MHAKSVSRLKFSAFVLLCLCSLPANGTTSIKNPNEVIFNCIEDEASKYFCTNVPVVNPTIILSLARLERKKLSTYVDAFRIMPALTNLTKQTIKLAQIQLTFFGKNDLSKIFIINQKLIPNSTSHTNLSYLIRSDVPSQALFYNELLSTWKNTSYDQLILELLEVKYQE
mgnify:CR=1 FL=1